MVWWLLLGNHWLLGRTPAKLRSASSMNTLMRCNHHAWSGPYQSCKSRAIIILYWPCFFRNTIVLVSMISYNLIWEVQSWLWDKSQRAKLISGRARPNWGLRCISRLLANGRNRISRTDRHPPSFPKSCPFSSSLHSSFFKNASLPDYFAAQ